LCFGKNKVGVDIWYKKSSVILQSKQQTFEECTCSNSLEYSNCGKKCERILDEQEPKQEYALVDTYPDLDKLLKNKKQYTSEELEGFEEFKKVIKPKQTVQQFIEQHGITEQQLIDGYKQGLELIFEKASKITEQEPLEEAAERFYSEQSKSYEDAIEPMFDNSRYLVAGFIDGAKWQAERMYSEEDMKEAYKEGMNTEYKFQQKYIQRNTFEEWFNQHKKK
jgi:hypothetical protein